MTTPPQPALPPTLTEIAELTAWCRRLTLSPAEPRELAAYQAAKADLLARIQATDHRQDQDQDQDQR